LIREFETLEQNRNTEAITFEMGDMLLQDDDPFSPVPLSSLPLDITDPDMNMDPFGGLPTNDSLYEELSLEADIDILADYQLEKEHAAAVGARKKVHFAEPQPKQPLSRSSSMSSEDAEGLWPDLLDNPLPLLPTPFPSLGIHQHDWDDTESCFDFDGDETAVDDEEDEDDEDGDATEDDESDYDCT
jgi:hypothetical protein